jgi:hypothetical protein
LSVIRIALVVIVVLAACSRDVKTAPMDPPTPTNASASVKTRAAKTAALRTDRSAYVLTEGKHGAETTIVATLRAPADQTLYILNCNGALSATLQRKVGGEWVWSLVVGSAACMSPPIVVPPGGEHTTSIYVNEGAGAIRDPQGGTMLKSGTYRVVWTGVLTSFDPNSNGRGFGPELPLEQRVSAPITLELPR